MKIIILIILLSLLPSCGVTDSEDNQKNYFPLQIGNKWYYSTNKNQTSIDYAIKWEIISKVKTHWHEYYLIEKTYYTLVKDTSYYRQERNKLIELFIGKSNTRYYLESIYADFDIQQNGHFDYFAESSNNKDYYYKVTLKNMADKRITFYYDLPQSVDEEHSITFEEGVGITEFYNDAWGFHN